MNIGVKIDILEFVDDSQPGWVYCKLVDVFGKEWFFTEKVPIVSDLSLDQFSKFPKEGIVNCIILNIDQKKSIVEIDTSIPFGIYSEIENSLFAVNCSQIMYY